MSDVEEIKLTPNEEDCYVEEEGQIHIDQDQFDTIIEDTVVFKANFERETMFHFCLKFDDEAAAAAEPHGHANGSKVFIHQGTAKPKRFVVMEKPRHYYMPIPIQVAIIGCLLLLSGLFSGLNLGLMSLDNTELKIVMKFGEKTEKKYAEIIYPIRKTGNYLLCTLLLGNVIVNSALTILFDDLTSGLWALLGSSLGIVIFGEIVPQAICSRHGLAVGAKTIWITRFFMVITAPASYVISKMLDKILGKEAGKAYTRERLLELIRLTYQSENRHEEILIMAGALQLARKTVGQVMTPLETIYMIKSDAILDKKTIIDILKSGHTRIPVYEGKIPHVKVTGLINVKDMALINPDGKVPVRRLHQHPIRTVADDTPLMGLLEEFKKGQYHLAFVQSINQDGPEDPFPQVVGMVTLEHIIEEIIQSEIIDETDKYFIDRKRPSVMEKDLFDGIDPTPPLLRKDSVH